MPAHRRKLNIKGLDLWYLVGLITSDGCLSSDGRHIDITSKDYDFLEKVRERFGFTNRICNKYNGIGQLNYHFQLGNRSFYDFLLSIGLSPRKSLTIKAVNVPENYFCDFLRGVIDGDGCIRSWVHSGNLRQQWSLRIYSGSKIFLNWLGSRIKDEIKVGGRIHKDGKRNSVFVLKFGKMSAKEIARHCYYNNCFGLGRKIKLAQECLGSYKGWSKSKTVLK
ncbi:MAG: LAGLIDADG family homing endonuclease [Candidatus Omnitrophica bacterium]|jgi:hypothetical protein|nr:LAGLIDADG family homing endonuclease [Candidatus Omnitrophota bacterium]